MLIGQYRCRHEHRHLLAVDSSLESSSHSHFRLAKAYVTAHQTVHGARHFHVGLHILSSFQLVGGVFIEERSLQLVLQVGVMAERKATLSAPLGVEPDEVTGNVLDVLLRTLLQPFPLASAQCRHTGRLAGLLRLVLRHLIERMDGDVDAVAMLVLNLDHLLISLFTGSRGDGHAHQPHELTDAMIDMDHIVANLELLNFLQREGNLAATSLIALQVVFVEAVEYLMVGEETSAQIIVDIAFMKCVVNRNEGLTRQNFP